MTADPQLLSGLGAAASVFLASYGSAAGTYVGGVCAVHSKDWKSFIPVVQAGVLSIYGLIVAIMLVGKMGDKDTLSTAAGYRHLSAGLANGLGCLASGYGMSAFMNFFIFDGPDEAVAVSSSPETATETSKNALHQPLLGGIRTKRSAGAIISVMDDQDRFRKIILVLIFLEAIGLYGFIVAVALILKN